MDAFQTYLKEFDQINISIITYYEILSGLTFKGASRQAEEFQEFIKNNNILHVTEDSAKISSNIYADLRRKGITIGTSDILIAGIAIESDLALITNNEKHYQSIEALKVENWKK